MSELGFNEIVTLICREDNRYAPSAYSFIHDGLNSTISNMKKRPSGSSHITALELLDGLRAYGLKQFGPLTKTVLNFWGVKSCEDFGEIVYNLIDYKIFNKSKEDRKEDFSAGYDFDDAFVKPYLPSKDEEPSSPASSCPQLPAI